MGKLGVLWFCSYLIRLCSCSCSSTACPPKDMCKEGCMQSPIDIVTCNLDDTECPPLCFSCNHWDPCLNLCMFQVGSTVLVKPSGNCPLKLEGGPLTGEFHLDQLHFHWCTDTSNGTEHSIDGCKYAMEAHLVYYNCIYGCAPRAINQPDGLAILAILMEAKPIYHNRPFETIVSLLYKLNCPGVSVPLDKNVLKMFKETVESQEYYIYEGSLTTPPCCEKVLWMVFKRVINIHCSQVSPFRCISNECGKICCNVRDIQPLNGRTIYDVTASCPCPEEEVCKKKRKKIKAKKKFIRQ